jgi:hypothetical protein
MHDAPSARRTAAARRRDRYWARGDLEGPSALGPAVVTGEAAAPEDRQARATFDGCENWTPTEPTQGGGDGGRGMKSEIRWHGPAGAPSAAWSANTAAATGTTAARSSSRGTAASWCWQPHKQRAETCGVLEHTGQWPADPRRQQQHASALPWTPAAWTTDTGSPLIWLVSTTISRPTRRRRSRRCGNARSCVQLVHGKPIEWPGRAV